MIEDKEIVYRDYIDISLAVATPKVCVQLLHSVDTIVCVCGFVCVWVCLCVYGREKGESTRDGMPLQLKFHVLCRVLWSQS